MPVSAEVRQRRRSQLRQQAALVRAVGGDPTAEVRGFQLMSQGRVVAVSSPYLFAPDARDSSDSAAGDSGSGLELIDPDGVSRGRADALGLLLRHSDLALHRELRPVAPLERLVFDIAEQLRCESLAPPLPGLRANIDTAFRGWCLDARRNRVSELGVALLVYTLTHMLRTRLVRSFPDEAVDDILESTRANISPIIGTSVAGLMATTTDQRTFAAHAQTLAGLISGIAGDVPERELDLVDPKQYRIIIPIDPQDSDSLANQAETAANSEGEGLGPAISLDSSDTDTDAADLATLGGYQVFTSSYDKEQTGRQLYPDAIRRNLRRQLDRLVTNHAVSSQRLAQLFRNHFGAPVPADWSTGEEDGLLDPALLSQLLANPERQQVFRQRRESVHANTAITFLLDNSGSMKRHRFESLAMLIDTCSRALDLAGVTNEVLGFTTAAWSGGQAQQEWRAAGFPANPGRLNETLHVVYKDAETSWRRSRDSLASLLRPMHFREGVDGEALVWAHQRLLTRPEPRRILIVVSDGAPTDSATANANGDTYLADHLARVVDQIERRSPILLGALTLDLDLSSTYRNSLPIELDDTLTLRTFSIITQL